MDNRRNMSNFQFDPSQQILEEINKKVRQFEDLCVISSGTQQKLATLNAAHQQQLANGIPQNGFENLNGQIMITNQNLQGTNNTLSILTQQITEHLNNYIATTDRSLGALTIKLSEWKNAQKVAQYGGHYPDQILQEIAKECKNMWKSFVTILGNVKRIEPNFSYYLNSLFPSPSPRNNAVQNRLLPIGKKILEASFFVLEQPPMLVKCQLTVKVGFLAMEATGLESSALKAQCRIINEDAAKEIKSNKKEITDIETIGTVNGTKIREIELTPIFGSYLGFEYRNIKIKVNSRKANTKDGDAVKTKYILLFNVNVPVLGNTVIKLRALSLPFMVSVHGSQDANLMATALWDNAFSRSFDDIPMRGQPAVPWSQLGEGLKFFFAMTTKSKTAKKEDNFVHDRGLDDNDLKYLKSRLFNGQPPPNQNPMITWEKFYIEPLNHVPSNPSAVLPITFWSWFYSITNMLDEKAGHETRMKALWDAHFIEGFVSKDLAEQKLKSQRERSFLIRFSDNHLSSVSFVVCNDDRSISHLIPFKSKDLVEKLTLPGLINACRELNNVDYVFPKKLKSDVNSYLPTKPATSPGIYDSTYQSPTIIVSDIHQTRLSVAQNNVSKKRSNTRPTVQEVNRQSSSTSTGSSHSFPHQDSEDSINSDFAPFSPDFVESKTDTFSYYTNEFGFEKMMNPPMTTGVLSNPLDPFMHQQGTVNDNGINEFGPIAPLIVSNNDFNGNQFLADMTDERLDEIIRTALDIIDQNQDMENFDQNQDVENYFNSPDIDIEMDNAEQS